MKDPIVQKVRLLERINKKLNFLLGVQLGKEKAEELIAEHDVPVNPQRQKLEANPSKGH